MNKLFTAALEIEAACRALGFAHCFIGGLAVQRWGEPRMTADVDLTIVTGFGGELAFIDALLARFASRLPDGREFALANRTLLLRAHNGIQLDVSLGAMPFEERAVERASRFAVAPRRYIQTCSAEDLVVHKALAGRAKDWLDIAGIVTRQGARLHRPTIWAEVTPLLELVGAPETAPRLRALLEP